MQKIVMLLVCASLTACGAEPGSETNEPVGLKPAALAYDGADYKTDSAKVAHGKRLAVILDCTGCHGDNFEGTNLSDANDGPMWAPNITLLLDKYSDAELNKLIRHGVPKDGREFWFMPVETYQFLSDADFAALTAYLRTIKPSGAARPPFQKNKSFQKDVDSGVIANATTQIARYKSGPPADLGKEHEWGRYLVQTTCTACHNGALQGFGSFTPDLDIAGAYSPAELETLLTTGKGKTRPDLGLMSRVAREGFSQFTPRERQAVIAYLQARANRPQSAQ